MENYPEFLREIFSMQLSFLLTYFNIIYDIVFLCVRACVCVQVLGIAYGLCGLKCSLSISGLHSQALSRGRPLPVKFIPPGQKWRM